MSGTELLSIILIAFGLSADCFAVAVSAGISGNTRSFLKIVKVGLFFGGFQALMPLIGWLAGRTVIDYIEGIDHWLAFGLLAFIGGKMIWESFHDDEEKRKDRDITRGLTLIVLSVATSIDALAVGLTFAFLEVNIGLACLIIGIVSFAVTIAAFYIGRKAGDLIGRRAEIVGGLVLIGIGIKTVIEHAF